ncbi:glutaredoxin family protein [Rhodococcus ruber]|uniref:Glutaredoxin domain-containing protein n=1 Tax=Rhodococcus ruber TaxID=1830 RepID=A0A098BVQ2_9NOCA|nr:glutaredoxin family protein [Rhodococcus ruber]MCD2127660.1 glutaredoxin family protein [Rhodococcus ruber]MCZ4504316.1 glutaredoxin family protein [Rhodococcus ruber]MCZ4529448.1 glutaredoxin family protein [Rhodococcus ruber]MCZ4620977.1 glutaredoxin family protein [Rhodococcus ruber]MDI9967001.1 glutaredoxin family protein [Rhodococcus ruber]
MTDTVQITVYSKPDCQQCTATARVLTKAAVLFEYIDVTKDPVAYARVQELGYTGVPVVEAGDMHWQGFRPDKLRRLAELHSSAANVSELDALAAEYLSEGGAA